MIAAIGGWLLSKIMGIAGSGIIEKAIDMFGKDQDSSVELKKEAMRAYVEQVRADVDLNKTKMGFPWYGVIVGAFVVGPALWWNMIFLDSIFDFPTDVLDVPVQIKEWLGQIITFIFYVSTPTIAVKALLK